MTTENVSLAQYARLHGCSPQAATRWVKRGRVVFNGASVDVEASDALRAKYRLRLPNVKRASSSSRSSLTAQSVATIAANRLATSGMIWSTDEARRVKESYLARLNQLDFDTRSGVVVPVADVATRVAAEYAQVRTKLLAIPAERAPQLHRLRSANEIQDALQALIADALASLVSDTNPAWHV